MKILVIGSGGREHAIVRALKKSPRATDIYVLPGNGGISADAVCVPGSATDVAGAVDFAREIGADFAVVTPDDPLCLGMADALEHIGVPVFGPSKAAAQIEGSKVFAKGLMRKYGIPTAAYEVFDDFEAALAPAHRREGGRPRSGQGRHRRADQGGGPLRSPRRYVRTRVR